MTTPTPLSEIRAAAEEMKAKQDAAVSKWSQLKAGDPLSSWNEATEARASFHKFARNTPLAAYCLELCERVEGLERGIETCLMFIGHHLPRIDDAVLTPDEVKAVIAMRTAPPATPEEGEE